MINILQTTITALSTFPDRPNYNSARAYATAVATWLRENKELSEKLATLIPELNTVIQQINSATHNTEGIETNIEDIAEVVQGLKDEALAFKNLAEKYANEAEDVEVENGEYSAKHWALKAYNTVATLPLGTLIDTLIGVNTTWSSTKIKGELDLKADKNVTYTKTQIDTNFQKKLVSGVNIKTINGESALGSGNLSTEEIPVGGSILIRKNIVYQNENYLRYSSNIVSTNKDILYLADSYSRGTPIKAYSSVDYHNINKSTFGKTSPGACRYSSPISAVVGYFAPHIVVSIVKEGGTTAKISIQPSVFSSIIDEGSTSNNLVTVDGENIFILYARTSTSIGVIKINSDRSWKEIIEIELGSFNLSQTKIVADNGVILISTNNKNGYLYEYNELSCVFKEYVPKRYTKIQALEANSKYFFVVEHADVAGSAVISIYERNIDNTFGNFLSKTTTSVSITQVKIAISENRFAIYPVSSGIAIYNITESGTLISHDTLSDSSITYMWFIDDDFFASRNTTQISIVHFNERKTPNKTEIWRKCYYTRTSDNAVTYAIIYAGVALKSEANEIIVLSTENVNYVVSAPLGVLALYGTILPAHIGLTNANSFDTLLRIK